MPVGQLGRRQAVLFSLIVHLMIVSFLANRTRTEPPKPKPQAQATRLSPLVFVPPRRAVPPPPGLVPKPAVPPPPLGRPQDDRSLHFQRPESQPTPQPTPRPRDEPTDRISIGTPDGPVQHEFTPARGGPGRGTGQPGQPVPSGGPKGPDAAAADPRTGSRRLTPGGIGDPVLPSDKTIMGSVRRLEERMTGLGATGEGGALRQMGPLLFDDQGADFTAWINQWRNEVYRNWIPPQAAFFGFGGGEVSFEFTVERDGSLSSVRMLSSTGSRPLDRAAENGLRGARMLPLPSDYAPPRLTVKVTFIYSQPKPKGEAGSGS